jgi:hypothetical protein
MIERSGSVPLTNGSGSRRPKTYGSDGSGSATLERGKGGTTIPLSADGSVSVKTRVSPFRLKIFKRNKANLDPFHMCFTISL